MARTTIGFGLLLIALGLGSYFGRGMPSITALIPAFLGAALVVLGLLALKDGWRKHAMHAAAMVGILGALGAGYRLRTTLGHDVDLYAAATTVLCVAFVALCVRSFIVARRNRGSKAET